MAKLYLIINEPLPFLLGNEQDLGLINFLLKTGVLDDSCIITKSMPNLCQIFNKNLIGTPVFGRNV